MDDLFPWYFDTVSVGSNSENLNQIKTVLFCNDEVFISQALTISLCISMMLIKYSKLKHLQK